MRRQFFIGALSAGILASAVADVFTPIDARKQADVNGKTVEMPAVNFPTVPQPVRRQPLAPVSGRLATPAGTIETKSVEMPVVQFSTVETKTISHSNFRPKRAQREDATIDAPTVTTPVVGTSRAPVTDRVIRANTPAGEQELKDQFHKPPPVK
jgi:hypothetical protein